ncbi:hypothetical protein [Paenibacillus endoradicis]|uniref:hypothetical protein n=1 Tax=Paenibacillus endoradicis TaxID=2972487 RepID=UPI002158CF89|nr:hypothetical protein [Paenibacillus endoradicis]MCR8657746.1 hypothetical protein [Paenibacillus endoradicis]
MELEHFNKQLILKHFAQLPFEHWKVSDLELNRIMLPFIEQFKNKSNYDLLIYLMEISFNLIVQKIEPIIDADSIPSQKLYDLSKAFVYFGHIEPDAYRIAFLIRPHINGHEHFPVESAIRFRVMIRKVFRLFNQQVQSSKNIPIELQVQGLMCVLNGIVVSTLSLQRMELIELNELSDYTLKNYLRGISNEFFPSYSSFDK